MLGTKGRARDLLSTGQCHPELSHEPPLESPSLPAECLLLGHTARHRFMEGLLGEGMLGVCGPACHQRGGYHQVQGQAGCDFVKLNAENFHRWRLQRVPGCPAALQHHPPTQFFLRPSGKLPGGTLWLLPPSYHLPLQKSVTPSSSLQEGVTCFWTALCLPFRGLKRPTCLRFSTQLRCFRPLTPS